MYLAHTHTYSLPTSITNNSVDNLKIIVKNTFKAKKLAKSKSKELKQGRKCQEQQICERVTSTGGSEKASGGGGGEGQGERTFCPPMRSLECCSVGYHWLSRLIRFKKRNAVCGVHH